MTDSPFPNLTPHPVMDLPRALVYRDAVLKALREGQAQDLSDDELRRCLKPLRGLTLEAGLLLRNEERIEAGDLQPAADLREAFNTVARSHHGEPLPSQWNELRFAFRTPWGRAEYVLDPEAGRLHGTLKAGPDVQADVGARVQRATGHSAQGLDLHGPDRDTLMIRLREALRILVPDAAPFRAAEP